MTSFFLTYSSWREIDLTAVPYKDVTPVRPAEIEALRSSGELLPAQRIEQTQFADVNDFLAHSNNFYMHFGVTHDSINARCYFARPAMRRFIALWPSEAEFLLDASDTATHGQHSVIRRELAVQLLAAYRKMSKLVALSDKEAYCPAFFYDFDEPDRKKQMPDPGYLCR